MPASPPPPDLRPGEAELRGVLERIVYANEENHFCIGELRPEKSRRPVTIVGTLPQVQCGETLVLAGMWTNHREYGEQFKVRTFRATLPATVHGIRKYLGSGLVPGIGKAYAEKIVDHFGTETLRIIEEESARLREVAGIGKKRAEEIRAAWDSQRALREVMMFLQTYGVTVNQCLRIVRAYGAQAREILATDPYQVAREIDGIGFKTADRLAINLGFANDSAERLDAGILHSLKELESEGHTGFPPGELQAHAADLLQADGLKIGERLAYLVEDRELRGEADSPLLQLPATALAEERCANALLRIHREPGQLPPIKVEAAVRWAQEQAGFGFAPEQEDALRQALRSKLSILTGGPGTGKTTILRALVAILSAKNVRLLLAAPTGRAAQRLSQAARKPAATIHRLLKFDPAKGGFLANENQPLNTGFVIIDEASMLDTRLASALFRAIPAEAHVLLVGDVHQLPSVGAGNVLGDLIACGLFPVTRLQQIFRQGKGSSIVQAAHGILGGQAQAPFVTDDPAAVDPRHDLHFIRAPEPGACVERVLELCRDWIPRWFPTTDSTMDVQVLAPMHRGTAGIGKLNERLQSALNRERAHVALGALRFHRHDKVIQLRNNYDKGIFNGDLGRVIRADADAGALTVDFDGTEVELERPDLSDLQPAYAISVHKSQGSEFPIVIVPLVKQHFMLLQRNLLYTALTRGRRKVFLVGDPAAYAMAVRNREATIRQTDLARKLLIRATA